MRDAHNLAQFRGSPYRPGEPSGILPTMATEKWYPDELAGFEHARLALPDEGDGELVATLVRKERDALPLAPRGAVLYVHGYVDYFFQAHLADAFLEAGFDFHALDLRRYGRSLRPHNVPNQCASIDDYFPEIDWAIEHCRASGLPLAGVVAHSTGGLIGSLYAQRGAHRGHIESLVLNSPFLEFRATALERVALQGLFGLGAICPTLKTPVRINPVYGQSLHESQSGEWSYDLSKKPLAGFGITAGWLRAIARGHAELQAGLDLKCPVLLLHSTRCRVSGRMLQEADRSADVVLDIEHMKKFGPGLGANVRLQAVADGLHDLTLSRLAARTEAIDSMVRFVAQVAPP